MDEQQREKPDEKPVRQEAALNHIDKLSEAVARSGSSRARVWLVSVVLSVLLLAVSTGVISLREEFSLAGLGIKFSLSVFLLGGGVLLAAAMVAMYSLENRIIALRKRIIKIYREKLDYDGLSVYEFEADPFSANDAIDALMTPYHHEGSRRRRIVRVYDETAAILALVVIILLPIIAELSIVIKLALTVGVSRYLAAPAILPLLLVLGATIEYFFSEST